MLRIEPYDPVRPEFVEGPLMVRQAHHERPSAGAGSSQLLIKRAVKHGLEQMLHAQAAGSLRGFQCANFGYWRGSHYKRMCAKLNAWQENQA